MTVTVIQDCHLLLYSDCHCHTGLGLSRLSPTALQWLSLSYRTVTYWPAVTVTVIQDWDCQDWQLLSYSDCHCHTGLSPTGALQWLSLSYRTVTYWFIVTVTVIQDCHLLIYSDCHCHTGLRLSRQSPTGLQWLLLSCMEALTGMNCSPWLPIPYALQWLSLSYMMESVSYWPSLTVTVMHGGTETPEWQFHPLYYYPHCHCHTGQTIKTGSYWPIVTVTSMPAWPNSDSWQ
jgi:hypothetical protein